MKFNARQFYLVMTLFGILTLSTLTLFTIAPVPAARAQSCDNIPQGSGESISADLSFRDTGQPISDTRVVPAYTWMDINAFATAYGQCIGMGWYCQTSPCVCQETGFTYERTVNHIGVYVDISTNTSVNGTYFVGNVYGKNPDGTGADFHELDTRASNSSGPLHFLAAYPGTYKFRIKAIINTTPCNLQPAETNEITITVKVGPDDKAPDNGETECQSVGRPVNVSNGNMYLQQTDYRLPGSGAGLEITRTYNSSKQTSGLFGVGWSSILDESWLLMATCSCALTFPMAGQSTSHATQLEIPSFRCRRFVFMGR